MYLLVTTGNNCSRKGNACTCFTPMEDIWEQPFRNQSYCQKNKIVLAEITQILTKCHFLGRTTGPLISPWILPLMRSTHWGSLRDWSLITGRGGLQNGKIAGPKLFAPPPPPSRQGKTFCTPPFKTWKLFASPLQYG